MPVSHFEKIIKFANQTGRMPPCVHENNNKIFGNENNINLGSSIYENYSYSSTKNEYSFQNSNFSFNEKSSLYQFRKN